MTEEVAALEAEQTQTTPEDQTADTPPEQAGFSSDEQAQEAPRDYENEAREMGWVPEAEFKGDRRPAKFLSAEEFVERGENVLPLVKKQLEREREASAKRETDFQQRLANMEKVYKATQERQQKQHEREIADVKAQMRAAVAAGDTKTYDKLEAQHDDLVKSAPEQGSGDVSPQQVVDAWQEANPWYKSDFTLHEEAKQYSDFIARPEMSLADNLAATEKHIKEKYPEKFGGRKPDTATAANGHAAVDGGGVLNGALGKKSTLVSRLPREALAQAKADVKAGAYKSEEEWAKVYFS